MTRIVFDQSKSKVSVEEAKQTAPDKRPLAHRAIGQLWRAQVPELLFGMVVGRRGDWKREPALF